jgi:hypothetical protein
VNYTRTVATPEGGSRFEDVAVPDRMAEVVPGLAAFSASDAIATAGATMLRIGAGWDGSWTSPTSPRCSPSSAPALRRRVAAPASPSWL